MKDQNFDFSAMQDIPPRRCACNTPRVQLSPKGLLTLNCALRKLVGGQRQFRARISADGRYLALCPREEPNIRFTPKSARTSHTALAQLLQEKGFCLPLAYVMEWCPEHDAWVGCCQELAPPPQLAGLARPGRPRRKAGGRTA